MQSTLWTLRRRIDRLASDDGTYRIVCDHSGLSPAPASRARFDDPQAPRYDLLVEPAPEHAPIAERRAAPRRGSL